MYKILFTIMFFLFQGLSAPVLSQDVWPDDQKWPTSSLSEQKLDQTKINELTNLINDGIRFPDIHSLLIVRNGYMVVEEYFKSYNAERIHMLQSVTKSFTSAAIGIAINQGKIRNVDEKILDYFPDIKDIKNLNDKKKSIKLKDLLTMRSGTDYHERGPGSPHYQLNALQKGWDRFYLDRPMVSEPGSKYQYDSGGVILMSAILKKRTGLHADDFLDKYLFAHLRINKKHWYSNSEGHPHTGGGLHLTPGDMAKFGLLYLRNGKWKNKQVVPESWVKESFKKHAEFSGSRRGKATGYGYLWWIQEPDPEGSGKHNIYSARGAYGQFIFVIPEHRMVVVVTGNAAGMDFMNPILFLYSHILPAVH